MILLWYIKQVAISFDQFCNAVFFGWADESFSARSHRKAKNSQFFKASEIVIDWIAYYFFGQKDHCKASYESEINRRQLPPEYRTQR